MFQNFACCQEWHVLAGGLHTDTDNAGGLHTDTDNAGGLHTDTDNA